MTPRLEGRAASRDGLELYWQAWPAAEPRAALLFVHGLADHSGRYANPIEYFRRAYACYALDLRGHGLSAGPRAHVDGFERYLDDVEALVGVARRAYAGLPQFLIGHSMGGLITLLFALRRGSGLAGVVANSPALRTHPVAQPSRLTLLAARVAAPLVPRLGRPTTIEPSLLSRDPEVIDAYIADPLVSRRVTVRWFTSYLSAQQQAFALASRLEVPVLAMASGEDRIVDPDAVAAWAAAAPSGRVRLVRWPGLYHESFNEPERQQVFKAMEGWIEDRLRDS